MKIVLANDDMQIGSAKFSITTNKDVHIFDDRFVHNLLEKEDYKNQSIIKSEFGSHCSLRRLKTTED